MRQREVSRKPTPRPADFLLHGSRAVLLCVCCRRLAPGKGKAEMAGTTFTMGDIIEGASLYLCAAEGHFRVSDVDRMESVIAAVARGARNHADINRDAGRQAIEYEAEGRPRAEVAILDTIAMWSDQVVRGVRAAA